MLDEIIFIFISLPLTGHNKLDSLQPDAFQIKWIAKMSFAHKIILISLKVSCQRVATSDSICNEKQRLD